MKKSSFKKGEDFENFVENNSFSKKDFSLIHRTNSKIQNKERFAENTKLPDFKFRSLKTLNEFYVEAKYRSKFDSNNQLDLLNESQFDRFNSLEYKEKIPVYIIIGLAGEPDNPKKTFLVPLKELKNGKVTETFINKCLIPKIAVNEENLKLNEYFIGSKTKESFKLNRNHKKLISILFLSLLSLFLVYNLISKDSITEKPIPKLISSKAINESYDILEYGTTVQGIVKNIGSDGYVIVRAEVKQEKKSYNKSKRFFLRKNETENFTIYFEETEFLKNTPTYNIKVFGVEN
jgi:hypothetical protein